ncbi:cell differentiation protein rcd1-like [Forsythia ovata]|uniref:Cell differentiation protein rcd1-like n=1 Tax=Forsythia ovata TaxID=205694 RepID=A0ABD1S788_9LAMI
MASPKPNSSSMIPIEGSASSSDPAASVGSSSPAVSEGSTGSADSSGSPDSADSSGSPDSANSSGSPASSGSAGSPGSTGSVGSSASATAVDSSASATAVDSAVSPTAALNSDCGMQLAEKLLVDLQDADLRENALLELSKRRERFEDLGLLLWHSFGTMAILMQEVICVYPFLSPPTLTAAQSNRVCNALALLQCVAYHPYTRRLFVQAHIPLYLYSFLTTDCKSRPFEYLRLTCLGVLGALVKVNDTAVICFLLATEIMPLCLRTMENGSELSKTVAAYILLKILQDGEGLEYVCVAPDRFYTVGRVLRNLVAGLVEQPSPRLLKHIIKCYVRISEDQRGRIALRDSLPAILMDGTFNSLLNEDPMMKRCLQQLLLNVYGSLGGLQGTVINIFMRMLSILVYESRQFLFTLAIHVQNCGSLLLNTSIISSEYDILGEILQNDYLVSPTSKIHFLEFVNCTRFTSA